jgi:hypothetical protein
MELGIPARVSASNQRKLREVIMALPDIEFAFSVVEFSELLELGCLLHATVNNQINVDTYNAQFSKVADALCQRGTTILPALSEYLSQDEATGVDAVQQLIVLCLS